MISGHGVVIFLAVTAIFGWVSFAAAQSTQAAPATDSIETLLLRLPETKGEERRALLTTLAQNGDPRLEKVFNDFSEGSLYIWRNKIVTCPKVETENGTKVAPLFDPFSREPVMLDGKAARVPAGEIKDVPVSRPDRLIVRDIQTLLKLSNPNAELRQAAVIKAGDSAAESSLSALRQLEMHEKNSSVLQSVHESIALIELARGGDDAATKSARLAAAGRLGAMRSARALSRLKELQKSETDAPAKQALATAITRIEHWQTVVEWCGNIFSGLSAGSILVLMGLGLAITFGLMGVINMAHGELMMIGAYATYVTQQIFQDHLPASAFNWYFVVAIPVSFITAALVGIVIEATVVRFLYGRPLDTLLATLGVSYILIQLVRVIFGDNRAVNAPSWLQGSIEIMQDVRLPYNRLFIIGFCILCICLMYFIVAKTKIGLLLRATTQNRMMAASLGVSTRRIDMLTFALGAGLAGMAGCALTQIGGVTPDMGQNYVIDSFLVVVVGGVGKLAGAIWSGAGMGITNKFLEPIFGAVWAKVLILGLVVAFIQRRPSGLFPAKGRLADV